jgi:uncharacterized protein
MNETVSPGAPAPTQGREEARDGADRRRFREILTGDIDIRIARDGTWYHEGGAIRRPALVKLFAGILEREAGGDYVLATPAERRRITVDDAPFVAVAVDTEGAGSERRLIFRTNVDDSVTAGPDHPIRVAFDDATGEPSPYVLVRPGLEALIARPVYYTLVELGTLEQVDGREALVVRSDGAAFVLGHP